MPRRSLLGLALLCVAVDARAQVPVDPRSPELREAQTLVSKGLELRREHHDAEALDAFRRAYALDASPRTRAQIALAEQALGDWIDAETDLQAAMTATDDAWIARNRALLAGGLDAIRAHLGWLEIEADIPRAEVVVDGVSRGEQAMPARLRVEAGSLVLELRAAGRVPARRMTSVDGGGRAREIVSLAALAPPEQPSREPSPPASPRTARESPAQPRERGASPAPRAARADVPVRRAGVVALGAAAAAFGLGTYFGVRTVDTKSQRDQYCTGQSCQPQGVALDAEARALAVDSTAWFVAGIVAAGAGAGLLWVSRSRGPAAASGGLRLSPTFGADRAGAMLGGSW